MELTLLNVIGIGIVMASGLTVALSGATEYIVAEASNKAVTPRTKHKLAAGMGALILGIIMSIAALAGAEKEVSFMTGATFGIIQYIVAFEILNRT